MASSPPPPPPAKPTGTSTPPPEGKEHEAKDGRYIPCIIKGNPPFPEGNNTVYLLEADLERAGLLTPERLAMNELETQHCRSTPLISRYYTDGRLARLSEPETAPSALATPQRVQTPRMGTPYVSDTEVETDLYSENESDTETVPELGSGPETETETESDSRTQTDSDGEEFRGGSSDESVEDMSGSSSSDNDMQ
ncbi:hypothetical protein DV738_g1675, partial [Chaetothyriales sp. CBS 135597]